MERRLRGAMLALSPLALLVLGCAAGVPRDALVLNHTSLQERRLETRRFPGIEEPKLVAGVAVALHNLGYTVEESDTTLGLVVGSKKRSARGARLDGEPVAGSLLASRATPVEKERVVRVSILVMPQAANQPENQLVRVTFQRIIWNSRNEVTACDAVVDPQVYFDFFEVLSKVVSVEARAI